MAEPIRSQDATWALVFAMTGRAPAHRCDVVHSPVAEVQAGCRALNRPVSECATANTAYTYLATPTNKELMCTWV
jgi:hypothetical protein